MQATKPIDEIVPCDRVVLLDGRPAVVQYNDAFVVRQGPRSTVLKHRLVTVTADGETVYVEARRRELVPIIVAPLSPEELEATRDRRYHQWVD